MNKDIHALTDNQAGAIQEFSATIQEIARNSQELALLAEFTLKSDNA